MTSVAKNRTISSLKIKAFTLIELLVVLGIIALLLAVISPMLPNVLDNARVKTATRHLASGLKIARSKAITSQTEMSLILDVENKTYSVANKNKKLTLPDDTTLTLTTAQSEQISDNIGAIRFFADGSSTGGRIKLSYKRSEYLIDVNWLTGKVTINP